MQEAAVTGAAFVPVRLMEEAPRIEAVPERDGSTSADAVKLATVPSASAMVEIEGAGVRVRFIGVLDIDALHVVLAHVGRRS